MFLLPACFISCSRLFFKLFGNDGMNKNQQELLATSVIVQSCVTGVTFHKKMKPIDVFHLPCLLRYILRRITLLKHASNQNLC